MVFVDPVVEEYKKKTEEKRKKRFEKGIKELERKILEIESITLCPKPELRSELETLKSDPEKYARIPIKSSGNKRYLFEMPETYQKEFSILNGL